MTLNTSVRIAPIKLLLIMRDHVFGILSHGVLLSQIMKMPSRKLSQKLLKIILKHFLIIDYHSEFNDGLKWEVQHGNLQSLQFSHLAAPTQFISSKILCLSLITSMQFDPFSLPLKSVAQQQLGALTRTMRRRNATYLKLSHLH